MAVSSGFEQYVVEQLEHAVPVTTRRMFGGVGVYADGLFFALLADDTLYFKVDDTNRPDFEAHGMEPFRPYGDERTMAYYAVPADVLEDADTLSEWSAKALEVARQTTRKKRPS